MQGGIYLGWWCSWGSYRSNAWRRWPRADSCSPQRAHPTWSVRPAGRSTFAALCLCTHTHPLVSNHIAVSFGWRLGVHAVTWVYVCMCVPVLCCVMCQATCTPCSSAPSDVDSGAFSNDFWNFFCHTSAGLMMVGRSALSSSNSLNFASSSAGTCMVLFNIKEKESKKKKKN